uniref:Lipocalin/cytosolic fatty-acid binding domain-containing protein n=1 Tax=Amblyomma maculatum TaxID=34609 RepID=G3MQL1_AMBMU
MLRFELAIFLTLALGGDAAPSFDEFLYSINTTQKIWTLQRNYTMATNSVDHECLFAHKVKLTPTHYEFTQNFTVGPKKVQTYLYAELGNDGEGPYMKIGHRQGFPELWYRLRAWYFHDRCGVMTFQSISEFKPFTGCDLFVWDHHIDGRMDHCLDIYNNICKGESHRVYWLGICKHHDSSNARPPAGIDDEEEKGC